jgi:hypothetical protein
MLVIISAPLFFLEELGDDIFYKKELTNYATYPFKEKGN